ncbi:MAG: hypothetical protein ACOC02_00120 [Guyparkeria sp.]
MQRIMPASGPQNSHPERQHRAISADERVSLSPALAFERGAGGGAAIRVTGRWTVEQLPDSADWLERPVLRLPSLPPETTTVRLLGAPDEMDSAGALVIAGWSTSSRARAARSISPPCPTSRPGWFGCCAENCHQRTGRLQPGKDGWRRSGAARWAC